MWLLGAFLALVRRPSLWRTALIEMRVTAVPAWWRRIPPLPLPSRSWLAFRMETAYGDGSARPPPDDVIVWLEWCRHSRLAASRRQYP